MLVLLLVVLVLNDLLRLGLLHVWHPNQTRISSLHLSILLQQPRILHFWVAISELMLLLNLNFGILLILLCVLLIFNHRLHFIIFKLTVT